MWINEIFFTTFTGSFIELFKTSIEQVDLAQNQQYERPLAPPQRQRNTRNRADIFSNVFPGIAVTTGGPPHQLAIFIEQANRDAVQLGLTGVFNFRPKQIPARQQVTQPFPYPPVKITQLVFREGIV